MSTRKRDSRRKAVRRFIAPRIPVVAERCNPAPWHPPAPAGGGKRFLATVKNEASRVSSSGRSRCRGEPPAPAGGGSTSEHPIPVRRVFDDVFMHVPVLNNLALVQPEDIDNCRAARSRLSHGMHVQDHVVAVNKDPSDRAVRLRKFFPQDGDEIFEPISSVGRPLVMLNVARAKIF